MPPPQASPGQSPPNTGQSLMPLLGAASLWCRTAVHWTHNVVPSFSPSSFSFFPILLSLLSSYPQTDLEITTEPRIKLNFPFSLFCFRSTWRIDLYPAWHVSQFCALTGEGIGSLWRCPGWPRSSPEVQSRDERSGALSQERSTLTGEDPPRPSAEGKGPGPRGRWGH